MAIQKAVSVAFLAVLCASSKSSAARVDFEAMPIGVAFGGSVGDIPGETILTQDGIAVSIQNFFTGSYTGFYRAEVRPPLTNLFSTRHLTVDNINLNFDFSDVGFAVNRVTVEYRDFGGASNFGVNGSTLQELPALAGLPINVAPGVTALVTEDSITLDGNVTSFVVGGQELAVDNIVAVPEPAALVLVGSGLMLLGTRAARSNKARNRR